MYKHKFTVVYTYVNIANCTSNNLIRVKMTGIERRLGSLITKYLLFEILSVKAACMLVYVLVFNIKKSKNNIFRLVDLLVSLLHFEKWKGF